MKTKSFYSPCALLLIFIMSASAIFAQNTIIVNGTVRDKNSRKKIESVYVTVFGTNIGTVTNADGYFSLKIKPEFASKNIEISHLGYKTQQINVKNTNAKELNIYLEPNSEMLKAITVVGGDARSIVEEAAKRIAQNYPNIDNMLTGFYRETIQKRRNYINISEAVVNIFKTPYTRGVERDRVQIFKGRKIISQKAGDTLAVKLQGGPTFAVDFDVVKNPDYLFNQQLLTYYKFQFSNSVYIDEREHYVIDFMPQAELENPLNYGKLYIDKNNLTISRAEINMVVSDAEKATRAILIRKPAGLRFKPLEVSSVVTYKQFNGKSYLNYVKNAIRFKCDWKRHLFSTNYTVVSEMVVTDRNESNTVEINRRNAFRKTLSLSDKVSDFYDPKFWEDFNIIEPSESLENAINKLKKKQK